MYILISIYMYIYIYICIYVQVLSPLKLYVYVQAAGCIRTDAQLCSAATKSVALGASPASWRRCFPELPNVLN